MKKLIIGAAAAAAMLLMAMPVGAAKTTCATIDSGLIKDSKGNVITAGVDKYGYNYQAHIFNGFADNYSRPATPVTSGDKLVMKWSDAWLANVDCDDDGMLDRGLVDRTQEPKGTSMGWVTNHYVGSYIDSNEITQHYTDFYKIVYVGASGDLWGSYHVIQEEYNDTGSDGIHYTDGSPGLGLNRHWTIPQ